MDSLTADQRQQWREVRKGLEGIGITVEAFEANKDFILDFLKRAVEAGDFEEQAPMEDRNKRLDRSGHLSQISMQIEDRKYPNDPLSARVKVTQSSAREGKESNDGTGKPSYTRRSPLGRWILDETSLPEGGDQRVRSFTGKSNPSGRPPPVEELPLRDLGEEVPRGDLEELPEWEVHRVPNIVPQPPSTTGKKDQDTDKTDWPSIDRTARTTSNDTGSASNLSEHAMLLAQAEKNSLAHDITGDDLSLSQVALDSLDLNPSTSSNSPKSRSLPPSPGIERPNEDSSERPGRRTRRVLSMAKMMLAFPNRPLHEGQDSLKPGPGTRAAKRQSQMIDMQLQRERRSLALRKKIVLLGQLQTPQFCIHIYHQTGMLILAKGAGEAGKSTVLKQMRLHYSGGFVATERRQLHHVIYKNLLVAFQIIIEEMRDLGPSSPTIKVRSRNQIPLKPANRIKAAQHCISTASQDEFPPPIAYLDAMNNLWQDQSVQNTIRRGNEFALHDNFH